MREYGSLDKRRSAIAGITGPSETMPLNPRSPDQIINTGASEGDRPGGSKCV